MFASFGSGAGEEIGRQTSLPATGSTAASSRYATTFIPSVVMIKSAASCPTFPGREVGSLIVVRGATDPGKVGWGLLS